MGCRGATGVRMHDGELDIDGEVVRRLVAAQFPELADLPISAVESTGTVNAIYRLGDRLCVRLPRVIVGPGPGEGVGLAPESLHHACRCASRSRSRKAHPAS